VIGVPAVPGPAADTGPEGRGWLAGTMAATVQVFERPSTWAVALAGFLARGGIVVLLVPIVPLPSPVGLANLVGPTAATPSGPSPEATGMLVAVTVVLLAWLVVGSAVGALSDAFLTESFGQGGGRGGEQRGDQGGGQYGHQGGGRVPLTPGLIGRLVGVRLAALVPLALAIAVAARPIVEATYRQLISPYDLALPLVSRVAREVAPAIGLVVGAWLLAEIVAGLAVRMIVLRNDSGVAALGHAVGHLVRRPATSLATSVIGLAGLGLAIGPPMIAASAVWSLLQASVAEGRGAGPTVILGLLLVAIWTGGVILCGVASAWRGLLWTAEVARLEPKRRAPTRTFGRGRVDP
jgi:hypothetical protein